MVREGPVMDSVVPPDAKADIDADIEELTNDVKRYKLTIATMWDLNPPQIVPVNEAEDSKGKKKAD